MIKIAKFMLVLAALPLGIQAQFYYGLYNQPPAGAGTDRLTDGIMATYHPDPVEFAATGWDDYSNGLINIERPRFVLTNPNGSAFNNIAYDIELSASSGQFLNAKGLSIAEHPNGYVIVGSVRSNASTGGSLPTQDVLILLTDHWGGQLDAIALDLGGDEVAESVIYVGGKFFLTGTSQVAGGGTMPLFVAFADLGGFISVLNAVTYNFSVAPLTSAVGKSIAYDPSTGNLRIAGAIRPIPGNFNGLVMEVDPFGVFVGANRYVHNPSSSEFFNAIKVKASGGLLITGEGIPSWAPNNQQLLVAHLEPGKTWMRIYRTPNNDGTGFDVIERRSPFTGDTAVFAAGLVNPGNTGNGAMLLYKIDNNPVTFGTPIVAYEYGFGPDYDQVYGVDMNNSFNPNDGGLVLFGTSRNEGSIVRTHFDGMTTCLSSQFPESFADYWMTTSPLVPTSVAGSASTPLFVTRVQYMHVVVCNSTNAGGSNMRTTGMDQLPEAEVLTLYPNPTDGVLHIEIQEGSAADKPVSITVFDLQGRQVHTETVPQGKNFISVGHLVPGMYMLKVICGNKEFTRKFAR